MSPTIIYIRLSKNNKKREHAQSHRTEVELNSRTLRTASPSPSRLFRRQRHTLALFLFGEPHPSKRRAPTSRHGSAQSRAAHASPPLTSPLLPMPAPALLLPVQSPFQAHSPAPNASGAGPPHAGPGPSGLCRPPLRLGPDAEGDSLSQRGKEQPSGRGNAETLGCFPSDDSQHSSHFVVLCRLPRGPARCGRSLFSPRLRHGLVGGAEALPATLTATAGAQLWVQGFRV